jgi:DNA polymerase III delta prime subunit
MDIWTEKYRPSTLEEYIGNESVKEKVAEFLNKGSIQNLLLYGSAGGGKTSLAKLIVKGLEAEYLYINASDERGIDTIREKIIPFASTISFGGSKIVILDEADYLTPQAQATLRNTIESFSNSCRFIFTCNYLDRIITPLQSRCLAFSIIPPSKREVAAKVVDILEKEKIKLDKDAVGQIIQTHYPDIRKVINTLQGSIKNDKIKLDSASLVNTDFEQKILDGLKEKTTITNLRQILADSGAQQFDSLFRFLYDNVNGFTNNVGMAIVIIAQYQYEYTFVIDKEICVAAMLNKLLEL